MQRSLLGSAAMSWLAVAAVFADAPPSRYTFPDRGTVYDTQTKLTWQKDVPSSSMTWEDAKTYCTGLSLAGTGWRMPVRAELLTLVDPTKRNPAIDTFAFPNTQAEEFWSSSLYAGSSGYAWYVSFGDGSSGSSDKSYAGRARCVR